MPARAAAQTTPTDVPRADYGWTLRALDGGTLTLEAFRGRVLFINLWASWCTPCVRELASIERLQDALREHDVAFLAVAAESEASARRFLRSRSYALPFYVEEQRAPPAFPLRGIPTTWVVDREGRIAHVRHGEAEWDRPEVVAWLRTLAEPTGR